MKKVIIFDIDGTLANLDHRLHLVNGPKKDWGQFLARVKDDLPIEQTIMLNNLLSQITTFEIVCASGRSDNERKDTEEWLAKFGVKYSKLYMRPAGDFRPDYTIKLEILQQIRTEYGEPWLIFDDRQSVVDMWRKEGLFVLQCAAKETFLDVHNFGEHLKFPLTLMVGPSGAGKTTILRHFLKAEEVAADSVLSSDAIRAQLTGDFRDQSQNERVFATLHELAKTRLSLGLPVVIDATNIRNADRIKAAKLAPSHVPVRYMVVDRPLEDKLKTAGWRSEVMIKDKPLVVKHHEIMQANLKDILKGDNLTNVTVMDVRVSNGRK